MFEIHRRPSRDLRNSYPELARIVHEHNDVVITNKGEVDLVMVNPADWEEFKRFRHNQYVLAKLREVEAAAEKPETWLDEERFWREVETL